MATLTIRGVDDELKARLRVRAAQHGQSMEAEVRAILHSVLARSSQERGIASRIRERFADLEDGSIPLPERTEPARHAELPS